MQKERDKKKNIFGANISLGRVSITQKLVFTRYLAVMLRSGMTISEALNIVYDQAGSKMRKVLKRVIKSVQSGNSLSNALKDYPKIFSNFFTSALYAGETSGTLENSLDNIASRLESEKELKSKIKGAMVYPIIVLTATFLLGALMAFFVLPKITPLFVGLDIDLPLSTRFLIWISGIIQAYGGRLGLGIIAFIIFSFWLVGRNFFKPFSHYLILKTPIIKNASRSANLANFSKTLGTLLKSGLTIDEAVDIVKNTTANYYYKRCLDKISKKIGQGTKLSDNLRDCEKFFPKMAINMIAVGEKSGNLEESLFYLAEFYEKELDSAAKAMATAVEPVMLIIIGLLVGGMALAIITPIYQITGNIQR